MERKQTNLLVFERTVWKLGSRDAIPDGCISQVHVNDENDLGALVEIC